MLLLLKTVSIITHLTDLPSDQEYYSNHFIVDALLVIIFMSKKNSQHGL